MGHGDEERRQAVIKDQLHVLSTQVGQNIKKTKSVFFFMNFISVFKGGADKGEGCHVERERGSCSQCSLLRVRVMELKYITKTSL